MPMSPKHSDSQSVKDGAPDRSEPVSNTEIAVDLGKSFVQSAIISPAWNGVGQLVSGGYLPQVSIVNEENAKKSSTDAWAQKIGSGAGMALDLFAMSLVAKRISPKTAEAGAESLTLSQRTIKRATDGFKLGATYGAAFVPSQPDDNIIWGRAKNSLSNGVTFAFMGGLSEAAGGVSILGKVKAGSPLHSVKEIAVTGAVGLPSGVFGAQVDSLINRHSFAGWKEMKEQATDYGVMGTVFASLSHGAAALGARPSMARPSSHEAPPEAPIAPREATPSSHEAAPEAPPEAPPAAEPVKGPELTAAPEGPSRINLEATGQHDGPVEAKSPGNFSTDPRELLAIDRGKPTKSESYDDMAGKGVRTEYADGTVVTESVYPRAKVTELPDNTVITESDSGIRTDFPDGSEVNITAYRTERRSPDGHWTFEPNHWAETWENWETATEAQKIEALSTVGDIPPGGNLVANIVEKGRGESNPALQELAIKAISKIPDADELANQWNLARDYNKQFAEQLNEILPNLSKEARQKILTGSSYRIETLLADLAAKHENQPPERAKELARAEYLNMVQDFSRDTRRQLWGFWGDVLGTKTHTGQHSGPLLKELAAMVRQEAQGSSANSDAYKAFAEFSDHPEARFLPLEQAQPTDVSRTDIIVKQLGRPEEAFAKVQAILSEADVKANQGPDGVDAINEAMTKASKILEGDSTVELKKMFFDWAQKQHADWIKDFADWQLSAPKRFVELTNEFIRLSRKDPLTPFHERLAMSSIFELSRRAPEYNINRAQVEATLQNTVQLMQIADANRGPSGELTRAGNQFRMIALQTMAQAADPYLIVQGVHPTCALAQVEFSTFMKHPDEASRLINEVMRTGKFVTTDGTTIAIDATSMTPEPGSLEMNRTRYDKKDSEYRSYASQIFQTVAANIHWQRQTIDPDYKLPIPKGSWRYEIHLEHGWDVDEHGNPQIIMEDRLMDYSQNPPVMIDDGPRISDASQLTDIGQQIGGKRTEPNVTFSLPNDQAAFENYIKSLPYPESFPLIVGIDANAMANPNEAFDHANHAISIVSPHQTGRRIYFHNTWYPGDLVQNHLGTGRFWSITER